MQAETSSKTAARAAVAIAAQLLDWFLIPILLVFLAAWILTPLRLNIGPLHAKVSWGWKPILLLTATLGGRLCLAWHARRSGLKPVGIWRSARMRRTLIALLDSLCAATILLIPIVWIADPLSAPNAFFPIQINWSIRTALTPLLIIAIRILIQKTLFAEYEAVKGFLDKMLCKKICFALLVTYVFFGLFETILMRAKFNAALPPIVFQGRDNKGGVEVPETLPDPELMFKFAPGSRFHGRVINSLGFREREVNPVKTPGVIRVLCMGDSVTAQGRPGYSQYLHELLNADPPTAQQWEAFNIGLHGYSSLQGLRLFQKTGRALAPDIVTVYFGWNDHWLSNEADRQKMGLEMKPLAGRIFELLRKKRVFSFVVWCLGPCQQIARRETGAERVLRVPPEAYQATMKAFVREIQAAGATPVLITAPGRSLTREVVNKRYVRSIEEGNQTHAEYAQITREVAAQTGAELLDLAELMAAPEYDALLAPDGIHFDFYAQEGYMEQDPPDQPGLRHIARAIDSHIRQLVKKPIWTERH